MNEELKSILEKVNDLYQKYGIKSVTMDDVARELGISKKTLYQHVKDKQDLVEQALQLDGLKKAGILKQIMHDSSLNAIEQVIEIYDYIHNAIINKYSATIEYDLKKYYPDFFTRMVQMKREHMFENMMANMEKGKKEGLYRSDLNEKVLATLHVMRVESILSNDYYLSSEIRPIDFFKELFDYHLRGIATEKGIKEFEKLKHKLNKE